MRVDYSRGSMHDYAYTFNDEEKALMTRAFKVYLKNVEKIIHSRINSVKNDGNTKHLARIDDARTDKEFLLEMIDQFKPKDDGKENNN